MTLLIIPIIILVFASAYMLIYMVCDSFKYVNIISVVLSIVFTYFFVSMIINIREENLNSFDAKVFKKEQKIEILRDSLYLLNADKELKILRDSISNFKE